MSNSIKIPSVSIHLDPKQFDYSKLIAGKTDLDGNSLQVDEEGVSLFLAEYTTWRELRSFIRDAISVACLPDIGEIRADVPGVRDEYDGFDQPFTMKLWFNAATWERFAY